VQTTLAVTSFAYAILMGAEGLALSLRKPWARWFTVIASSSLVPVEIYEIVREVHPIRVVVLVINVSPSSCTSGVGRRSSTGNSVRGRDVAAVASSTSERPHAHNVYASAMAAQAVAAAEMY
jgi:Predicted membrane protein (DUF2127)